MLHLTKPSDFNPKFVVTGGFLEHDGEFILLERHPDKPQPGTWGIPGGKVDEGETLAEGLIREVWEETGITLLPEQMGDAIATYVQFPEYDFAYHMFRIHLPARPTITIDPTAHTQYTWQKPTTSKELPLIQDLDTCIDIVYK